MDKDVFVGKENLSFEQYKKYRLRNWINYTRSLNYYSVAFFDVDHFDFFIDQELYTLLNAFFLRDQQQSLEKLNRFKGQCFGDMKDYRICMILRQKALFSHFKELVKVQNRLGERMDKSNLKDVKILRKATWSDWNGFLTRYNELIITEEKRQDNFKFASRRFLFKMKNIKRDSRVVSVYSLLLLVIYALFISPLIWSKTGSQNGNTALTIQERTIMKVDERSQTSRTEEDKFLEWETNTLANQADDEWGCAYNSEMGQTMLYDQSGRIVRVKYPNHFLGSWSYIYSSETGETTFYNKSNFVFKIKHSQKMLSSSEFNKLVDVVKSYKRGDYSKYCMIRSSSPFLNNMEEQKKSNQSLVKPPAQASNARAQLLQKKPECSIATPKRTLSVVQPRVLRGAPVFARAVQFEAYDNENPRQHFHNLNAENLNRIKTESPFDEAIRVIDIACSGLDPVSRRERLIEMGYGGTQLKKFRNINTIMNFPDILQDDATLIAARAKLELNKPYTRELIRMFKGHINILRENPSDPITVQRAKDGLKAEAFNTGETLARKYQLLKYLLEESETKALGLRRPRHFVNLLIGQRNHQPSYVQAEQYQSEFNKHLRRNPNANHEDIVYAIAARHIVSPNYIHYGLKLRDAYPLNSPANAIYCQTFHTVAGLKADSVRFYVVKQQSLVAPYDTWTKLGLVSGDRTVEQRYGNERLTKVLAENQHLTASLDPGIGQKLEAMVNGKFQPYCHYRYDTSGSSECVKVSVHPQLIDYARFVQTELTTNAAAYKNKSTEDCISYSLRDFENVPAVVLPRFEDQFPIRPY